MKEVLLVDNYDSFTNNVSHLVTAAGGNVTVVRNDDNFLPDLKAGKYDSAIIGPGPGSPDDPQYFGRNHEVITEFGTDGLPILGICLGFQGIAHAFGARLKRAKVPEQKRVIITELFEKLTANGDSLSVTLTKFTQAIAQKTEETVQFLQSQQIANRTFKKAPATSVSEGNSELEKQLRSIWQEFVDNYRTFAADIKCDIKRARELLDDAKSMEGDR